MLINGYLKIISLRKNGILYLWVERISSRFGVNLISQDIVRIRMVGLRSALLNQGHSKIPEDLGLLSSSRSGTGLCSQSHTKPTDPSVGAVTGTAQVKRRHSKPGQSAATLLLIPKAQKLPAQYSSRRRLPTWRASFMLTWKQEPQKVHDARAKVQGELLVLAFPVIPKGNSLLLSKCSSSCPSFRWSPQKDIKGLCCGDRTCPADWHCTSPLVMGPLRKETIKCYEGCR